MKGAASDLRKEHFVSNDLMFCAGEDLTGSAAD